MAGVRATVQSIIALLRCEKMINRKYNLMVPNVECYNLL